jgi:hypothetical protein
LMTRTIRNQSSQANRSSQAANPSSHYLNQATSQRTMEQHRRQRRRPLRRPNRHGKQCWIKAAARRITLIPTRCKRPGTNPRVLMTPRHCPPWITTMMMTKMMIVTAMMTRRRTRSRRIYHRPPRRPCQLPAITRTRVILQRVPFSREPKQCKHRHRHRHVVHVRVLYGMRCCL